MIYIFSQFADINLIKQYSPRQVLKKLPTILEAFNQVLNKNVINIR